jgi:ribosomal protein L40E
MRFIDAFKSDFARDQLINFNERIKEMYIDNPLFLLMNISKQQKQQNTLVNHLIALAASMIEINNSEIIHDTFTHPSRQTCIYIILFDESLNSVSIRQQIINCLNDQWMKWKEGDMLIKDVWIWRNFSNEETTIVHQIWTLMAETTGEQYQFDALFNDAYRNLNLKLEMMDNVVTCLNTYCQKATDKNSYETMIDQWNERLEQNNMGSIQFPTVVDNIVPYVEKINPYAEARAWREVLNNQSEMNDKIESIESQHRDTDESTWMQNDLLSTSNFISYFSYNSFFCVESFASIQIAMINATLETREITCEQIIRQAVQSLDDFQRILRNVCTDQSNGSIQQIIDLFPDIRQAENDLEILQPLIGSSNIPRLLSIVSFWKNHFHIKQICAGSIYLSAKVHAIIDSSFLNTLCAIDEQTSGEKCIAIYEQYQNQYERQFSVKVLTFLSYYGSSLELFAFIHSLTADDVYNLEEAVNDCDETLVNTETVFDFALVKNFVDCVYAAVEEKRQWWKETPFLFKHVIACFEDIWQQSQFGDLLKCLESSSLALTSIKRIHLELTDKEQSQRRRIADILRESIIIFFRIGRYDTTFDVNVQLVSQQTTNNDKLKQLTITFTDLSELHDRVRLLEYSSNTNQRYESKVNSNMHDVKQLHNFIEFISIVESIIKTLTHLFKSGHPTVKEFLAPEKTFSCIDGKYADLLETSQILTNQLNEWEKTLCNIYKTHIDLTYFSGDQFWLVEDYIYNRSSLSHPGYHLLKFIGIDPNSIEKPVSRPQKPEERLKNLGRLLSQQRHEFISQENIPKRNNVLLIETTHEGILRAIMSLFSRDTIPASGHRLFYCTLRTSWIEIRAFVYRCFYSRSLHQLIRPELLFQSIQDNFIRLLCSLIQETPDQTFRMGIITTTKITNQQLIGGLQSMQILTICRDQELLNKVQLKEIMDKLVHGCTLVRSKIAGLGKSTIIRRDIQSRNKTYVKFPIYGDLDIDTLAERLCSKFSQLQTGVIHLDIGLTDNSQSLNELLYSLVIFRSFRFGYVAASIPADVPMYIEIDTSPQSILKELHLIQHLSSPIDLKEFNWEHLDVENKEIQTVANYLQAIANRTITKQNVNESTFIKLDAATCAHLLQDPFLQNKNPEYITWTQLSIFNAVFHRLFEGFSLCGFFLVESVPRPELRMDLVKTLLQSSNQFTSLSVEAVRKQQRAATSDATVTFSDAIVGWDKIQPFTMVFTATNDPLFVYKSSNDVPRALIEYVNAYHRAAKRGTKITTTAMFPDYNELTHDQFFLKLTSLSEKYLNKSICPKCFLQYEFQIERCERCFTKDLLIRPRSLDDDAIKEFQLSIAKQVQMEYVLTKDNFIKMLLIYLRIQSGIPVLIMGETGEISNHLKIH